jgi:germination protein M
MARKKNSSLGCLFWIALILLVLVVFLFSRERINAVLESTGLTGITGFFERDDNDKVPEVLRVPQPQEEPTQEELPKEPATRPSVTKEEEPEVREQVLPIEELREKEAEREETPLVDKKLRSSILFFVTVDDSGAINLQHVTRPVYFEASPLTRTMEALMQGLSPAELNRGMLSLIPDGTVLRSVAVKDRIAYIDFNEAFAFNEFGAEGAKASLKQVVFTATEFPTVDAVQITIQGKRRDYLASEGVKIAEALTRDSFR